MRALIIMFCLSLSCKLVSAQENYDANLIPKELMSHASAVIRNEETSIEVKDLDYLIFHVKKAITVLNKNGDEEARIVVEHDKSSIIKYIKGAIYNDFGKQIGKFSESDFEDISAADGFSLFQDTRLKHYLPSVTDYPYTISVEYEVKEKQTLGLGNWEPNPEIGVAVEKSSFSFSCKPDFNIRYKEFNFPGKVITDANAQGLKTYTWKVNNLKAIKYEPFSPYPQKFLTSVRIAPYKFVYYGIGGSFNNWKDLGKWEYDKLIADRQELPAETIEHVKEMTKDIADPKLKAKKIYEYMQGRTHYISVQVGIGGNQPFLASDVDKQNYGDCKALVNYTQALLKAANIDSYYCVVKSGRDYKVSMLNDFASMDQGDHVIICLPFKNDTTWAECTSQSIPFGFLSDFTDDRDVLACTPNGGKLMHTPKYTAKDNLESLKANFVINEDGKLSGEMNTTFKGVDYDDRSYLATETRDEQTKLIKRIYPINNMNIESLEFKRFKSQAPEVVEDIKLNARDYASVSDGKIFFMLNSFNRSEGPPAQTSNRLNDVYINRGYTENEEVTYTIPAGYTLEKQPLDYSVSKPFGDFSVSMTLTGDKIVYRRKFQLNDGTFSKDMYSDLVDFYQAAYDADQYTVSLVKKP